MADCKAVGARQVAKGCGKESAYGYRDSDTGLPRIGRQRRWFPTGFEKIIKEKLNGFSNIVLVRYVLKSMIIKRNKNRMVLVGKLSFPVSSLAGWWVLQV